MSFQQFGQISANESVNRDKSIETRGLHILVVLIRFVLSNVKLALHSWHNNLKPFQQTLLGLVGRCWTIVGICWNVFQKLFKFKVCSANYMASTTYANKNFKTLPTILI